MVTVLLGLAVLSPSASAWTEEEVYGSPPSARAGGQMRQVGNELILFGGMLDCFDDTVCDNVFYNDIYHFDLDTNTWSAPEIIPDPVHGFPEPRAFLGATVYEAEEALVIYGGTHYPVTFIDSEQWMAETTTFGDLWFYYPETHRWRKMSPQGEQRPGQRSGTGLEIINDQLILSSGVNSNTFQSVEDIWSLDLNTLVWTQLTGKFSDNIQNPFPFDLGRYIFPFLRDGNNFYAFSGNIIPIPPLLGEQHQDLWTYDVVTNTWDEILPFQNGLTGRVHGGAAIAAEHLVVFFGDTNNNVMECRVNSVSGGHSAVNETWVSPLVPTIDQGWDLKQFSHPVPALKRIYFANSTDTETIYVWGGFNVLCPPDQPNGGQLVWNDKLYTLDWAEIIEP